MENTSNFITKWEKKQQVYFFGLFIFSALIQFLNDTITDH